MTDRQQATEKIHAMRDGIEAGINVERWHDLCTHDRVVALKCLIMAGLVDKTDLPDGSANLDFVRPDRETRARKPATWSSPGSRSTRTPGPGGSRRAWLARWNRNGRLREQIAHQQAALAEEIRQAQRTPKREEDL